MKIIATYRLKAADGWALCAERYSQTKVAAAAAAAAAICHQFKKMPIRSRKLMAGYIR